VGNSVASIRAAEITDIAAPPDVSNLINGRAPGVVVTPGTGMVGSGPTVRIRGTSSFSLNTQPLVYVDGVRLDNAIGTGISVQGFGNGVINRLNDINPEDIESIEIIKGPAAATLYGTEASNGVIQIITKKGRAGETELEVNVRQGANWFKDASSRVNANWGIDPDNGEPYQLNLFDHEQSLGNPGIFETGHMQSYGGSLRGGTDQVRYFISGDIDLNEGIEPTNHLWRVTSRANVSVTPNEKWDVTASIGYNTGRTNLACEGGCGGRFWAVVFGDPSSRDTDFRGFRSYPPEIISEAIDFWQDADRSQLSLQATHRPNSWLSQRITVGQDQVSEQNVELAERMSADVGAFFGAASAAGWKFRQNRDVATTTFDYSATVDANVTGSVSSATTVGTQYYRRLTNFSVSEGNTFPAPGLTVVDALAQSFGGEDVIENNTLGFFAQQRFGFNDRIFLTGAVRGDDNSAFGQDFDFVIYPKVSGTWVIDEESFWNIGFIDAFKLRTAFGQSGQQPEDFAALRTFQPVTGGGGVAAVTPQFVGNDSLAPEKGTEFEAGFEAGLFNSRIGIDFTYYNTRTKDAILSRNVPPSTGFPGSQFVNAGEIRNSGFEVQLNALAIQTEDVVVDLTLNLATNKNRVQDLGGIDQGSGFIAAGSQRRVPGFPVAAWFDEIVVDATLVGTGRTAVTENPMCDGGNPNGATLPDGTPLEPGGPAVPCSEAPLLYIGSSTPDFEGSFSSTITLFGNLQIYGLVDWKTGYKKLDNNLRARCQVFNICEENFFPENFDPAVIAEIQSGSPLRSFVYNDAKFAKLREISATWQLPQSFARKLTADRAAISLAARNLFTWSPYTGLDPEASFTEQSLALLEQSDTPQLAQFVASFMFTF
jgi:TonB-linked SusC/RagA family outer membrane protein